MLNIAGADYDYAQVVYVVLQECEHRRRGFEDPSFEEEVRACATEKLTEIKAAYDEFGGSAAYWEALEKEVDEVVLPLGEWLPAVVIVCAAMFLAVFAFSMTPSSFLLDSCRLITGTSRCSTSTSGRRRTGCGG